MAAVRNQSGVSSTAAFGGRRSVSRVFIPCGTHTESCNAMDTRREAEGQCQWRIGEKRQVQVQVLALAVCALASPWSRRSGRAVAEVTAGQRQVKVAVQLPKAEHEVSNFHSPGHRFCTHTHTHVRWRSMKQ